MVDSTPNTTFDTTTNTASPLQNRSHSFSATLSRTSSSLFDTFKKSGSLCLNNIKQTPLVSIAISPRAKATTTTDSTSDIQSSSHINREHNILSSTKYKSMSSTEYRSLSKKKVKKRSYSAINYCFNDDNTPSNLLTYDQVCTLHERYGLNYDKKEVKIHK